MIILIIVAAFLLRLILVNQSLWLDEAIQVIESSVPFSQVWQIPGDFHPPLFHYLAHFWLKMDTGEWFIRLLPILLSLGGIYFTYLLGKELKNKQLGFLASLFLATSSFAIYYSQEFRPYALSLLLATVSYYFFYQFVKNKHFLFWPYIISNILGVYSLYLFPLIFASQLLVAGLYFKKAVKKILTNILISCLFFLPWIPMFFQQLQIGQGWAQDYQIWKNSVSTPLFKALPLTFIKFWLGNVSFENIYIYFVIFFLLLILTVFLIHQSFKKYREQTIILLIFILAPVLLAFLLSFQVSIIAPKRLLLVLPQFYLLLSLGCLSLKKFISNFLIVLILLINISSLVYFWQNPRFQREQWRQAIGWIEQNSDVDTQVILKFAGVGGPWNYYSKSATPVTIFDKAGLSIEENLSILTRDQNKFIVIDYLTDLADPQKRVDNWFLSNNFKLLQKVDFAGVGFILKYQKQDD